MKLRNKYITATPTVNKLSNVNNMSDVNKMLDVRCVTYNVVILCLLSAVLANRELYSIKRNVSLQEVTNSVPLLTVGK